MNIGNYHLYADIDDVERKFVIGKKKEKFSYIKQTGVANISNGELTKMAEKYFKLLKFYRIAIVFFRKNKDNQKG